MVLVNFIDLNLKNNARKYPKPVENSVEIKVTLIVNQRHWRFGCDGSKKLIYPCKVNLSGNPGTTFVKPIELRTAIPKGIKTITIKNIISGARRRTKNSFSLFISDILLHFDSKCVFFETLLPEELFQGRRVIP
jgi:hypothetical protein